MVRVSNLVWCMEVCGVWCGVSSVRKITHTHTDTLLSLPACNSVIPVALYVSRNNEQN